MSIDTVVPESGKPAWTAIGISKLAVPGARVEFRVIAQGSLEEI